MSQRDIYESTRPFIELDEELAAAFGGKDKIPEKIRNLVDLIFDRYSTEVNEVRKDPS